MRRSRAHSVVNRPRSAPLALLGIVLAVVAGLVVPSQFTAAAAATDTYSIWPDSSKPSSPAASETRAVELGVQFSSSKEGWVTGIRYYKQSAAQGSTYGTLWSKSGQVLAKATFTSRDGSGWKTANLATPVKLQAGTTYVASYTAPAGRYSADTSNLGSGRNAVSRELTAVQGVYNYSLGFPTSTWASTNYYADVVFTTTNPTASAQPATTATSRTTAPATTAPKTTTTTTTPRTTAPVTTTTTSSTAASGFPNSSNTGYRNAPGYSALTPCSGPIKSNTTYKFCNFSSSTSIGTANSPVSNVTFIGTRFASNALQDANVAIYGDNISFDYSSFEPSAVAKTPVAYTQGYQYGIDIRTAGKVTIDHSDFWGWGNGIQFGQSSQAKPLVVKNTWFHDARSDGGGIDHTDAILSNEGGPSYMVFDHNTIASVGNTQGLALQTESRAYDNVTITNNYFSGFGYTVAIGETIPSTNITFTGNVFGTDFKPVFGSLYSSTKWGSSGNTWKNNKWKVVAGSYYTPTSDDGKYFLPNGAKSTTDFVG